jgi:hypothetical protein
MSKLLVAINEGGMHGKWEELDKLTVENVEKVEVVDWNEYEENIEFEMMIVLRDGDRMAMRGYNGLWEMLSYDKLRDECKKEFLDGMIEWAKQYR